LTSSIADLERTIADMRSGKGPSRPARMGAEEWAATLERYLPWYRERADELRATIERDRPWRFADSRDQVLHEQLDATCDALERLAERSAGVAKDGERAAHVREVMARNEGRWSEARAAIATMDLYGGRVLETQTGLVPIGADPVSGLWEFWHVLSGEEPLRDGEGHLVLEEETGIVLVLLPGATTTIGSQRDPGQKNYDPAAHASEEPIQVRLDPYFLAKYELTQSQWLRLTGTVPSMYCIGSGWASFGAISGLHPVENISWQDAVEALGHVGLELPTEARWEYGARAFTEGPYWFGESFDASYGENHFDSSAARAVSANASNLADDGFPIHGPVQLMPANPFGLRGVLGNVRELCLDRWSDQMGKYPVREGSCEILNHLSERRCVRGGSFAGNPFELRVALRTNVEPHTRFEALGVRPARSIEAR
jgi:formylglycine-generating enzyme required for sulfatase activity